MAKLKYGLIGHPVVHSLSPVMQNAAFEKLGIDAEYELFDVPPEGLQGFLEEAPSRMSGFNVTIPHKIKAAEFIKRRGSLDAVAARLGAVNTVKVEEGGKLSAYNTDGPGFYRSLVEDLRFEPEGKTIIILGAGGAASGIAMYLGSGPGKIYVYDTDEGRTGGLESRFREHFGPGRLISVRREGLKDAVAASQLLINATPAGMKEDDPSPVDKDLLHAGMYVYDLVYNRPLTALIREARMLRCRAVTGIGMLLYQGAIAFEIWTGRKAPVDVMRKALKAALANI